jgi:hypothetical protein
MFYCASTEPTDLCPKSELQEQRGLTLCTLARLQKQRARSDPYMVVLNFIGYFILVLCDFPLPGATWPSSCSDFSGFISLLCHPYLSTTFSGLRPSLFSSDPPPCYVIPPLMLGSYFHSIITCAAIFLSVMASIIVQYQGNQAGQY